MGRGYPPRFSFRCVLADACLSSTDNLLFTSRRRSITFSNRSHDVQTTHVSDHGRSVLREFGLHRAGKGRGQMIFSFASPRNCGVGQHNGVGRLRSTTNSTWRGRIGRCERIAGQGRVAITDCVLEWGPRGNTALNEHGTAQGCSPSPTTDAKGQTGAK